MYPQIFFHSLIRSPSLKKKLFPNVLVMVHYHFLNISANFQAANNIILEVFLFCVWWGAVLGLGYFAQAFFRCDELGLLFVAEHGL